MRTARIIRVLFLVSAGGFLAAPAHAQWQPPIGIPAPSFGITQTAPAAPNPWTTPVPGFYYVEQKSGATNINNPYGTPARPRISIPNPIPAGAVVELHGFYDVSQSSPNTILAQGTPASPVFIRGASGARPIIRRAWEVTGTYLILENLEFAPMPDQSATGSLVVLAPTSYMAIRHSDLHGTLDDGGMGVENWNGGVSRVDNVVIWDNVFHDNGDVTATFDQDVEGIHVGSHASYVWVVDNEMARNSGDGIQINATEQFKSTTHHIYVGRNVSHHNKQGGFWVKQAVDVIFSQNVAYSHRPGNSSLGHCLGGQYAPDYVWWIFNQAYDCEFGIALFSDWEDGQQTHQYFVGNVIRNIHNTQPGVNPNDDWSPAAITVSGGFERHFVNNTFNDVDSGINIASPFGSVEIKNNIITNLSQANGNHANVGFGSVASAVDHNLFFPTPRVSYDGTKFFLTPAQMAAMKSIAADPQFKNPAAADFRIRATSPAAGSGEYSNVYTTFQNRYGVSLLFDADGTRRPQTTTMDMGAYALPFTPTFDGDSKSDVVVFRPSNGVWYILKSSTNFTAAVSYSWGLPGDKPIVGDFDGDGRTDLTIYRPSNGVWYILKSSTNFTAAVHYTWGLPGDIPVAGDFDGDRRTDVAIFRPGNGVWYILKSSANFAGAMNFTYGLPGDIPVAGDFDGDRKADAALFRPSTGIWYILKSSTSFTGEMQLTLGVGGDIPVASDYDGDGRIDPAVYRPSTGGWTILNSTTSFATSVSYAWGLSIDIPSPGDFDGDGRTDLVVFRPSNGIWYILKSSTNFTAAVNYTWGLPGDIPVVPR